MKRAVISAPGRVCLFGEHMDWCNYYVIPAAIDMRSFLEVTFNNKASVIEVYSYPPFDTYAEYNLKDLKININSDLRYVGAVLKAMLMEGYLKGYESLRLKFIKAEEASSLIGCKLLQDLPVKKGLSSSAAISVATAFSISLATLNPIDEINAHIILEEENNLTIYASLAYIGENNILGINCGQMDQFASAYGGLLFIDCRFKPAKVERLNSQIEIPIVIGDTGQTKDTSKILAWLGERFRQKEPDFMEGVKGIIDILLEAREELHKNKPDLYKLGELMNLNQYYLAHYLKVAGNCPISPSRLDALIKAALDAGALGAKLTGSGGGGCMIALCLPDDIIKVSKTIIEAGGYPYVTRISCKGLRLEYFEE